MEHLENVRMLGRFNIIYSEEVKYHPSDDDFILRIKYGNNFNLM